MKFTITLFTLVFSILVLKAQTDCSPYVPTEEGSSWEITNYNPKGKVTGTISYELLEKKESGNKIDFTVRSTTYDKKGKELAQNTFTAECEDGKFHFDMTYMMDPNSSQAFGDMDVEVDATEFEIPSMKDAPGTRLSDGSLKVSAMAGGAFGMNLTILVTDRIVDSHESVTTSAGTFECLVLTQNISTKMMVKINASSKEWYAENVGMIRSESYNKKGKLTGYSELTKLNRT